MGVVHHLQSWQHYINDVMCCVVPSWAWFWLILVGGGNGRWNFKGENVGTNTVRPWPGYLVPKSPSPCRRPILKQKEPIRRIRFLPRFHFESKTGTPKKVLSAFDTSFYYYWPARSLFSGSEGMCQLAKCPNQKNCYTCLLFPAHSFPKKYI